VSLDGASAPDHRAIGFSQRRTIAYLYGWTVILAAVALALQFVPDFDALWTAVMAACLIGAAAASFRLLAALEILKLRNRQDAARARHGR
jgi:UDP-GlcNAc:undecaprenyl-phosphate GlcNAc-1-phosphate transferase